ncbi:hypothetical protein D3C73_1405370 [compost metagenome]
MECRTYLFGPRKVIVCTSWFGRSTYGIFYDIVRTGDNPTELGRNSTSFNRGDRHVAKAAGANSKRFKKYHLG